MSTDVFILFSPARISREEYTSWLHQLNAVMIPEEGDPYDARLSKDVRHVWISLLESEWFEGDLEELEDQPEVLEEMHRLLGEEPRSAIELATNDAEGSQILAVQLAALCAEHYPCVVLQTVGNALIPREEVLELRNAGMGFDGFTWETADPARPFPWEGPWIREAPQENSSSRAGIRVGRFEGHLEAS